MSVLANPVFAKGRFASVGGAEQMTVAGTAARAIVLLALVIATAGYTWWRLAPDPDASGLYILGGLLGGLVLVGVTVFKQNLAPWTAALCAVAEGLALGAISMSLNVSYPGVPARVVLATFAVALAMFGLFAISGNRSVRALVALVLVGILFFVLGQMALDSFGVSFVGVNGSRALGIAVIVVLAVAAAFSLLLGFERIERGADDRAPKTMEWYGALGLTVALVWMYIEILDLFRRLLEILHIH